MTPRSRTTTDELYTRTAEDATRAVIASYSTSFGLAVRLLGVRNRHHIRNIYALVRIADEIVDGLAAEAGLADAEQREMLDRFASATHAALSSGISDNLVIHAFAKTARAAGIDAELIDPFFASMRADIESAGTKSRSGHGIEEGTPPPVRGFDANEHAEYVFGSAEVVGLMCLKVFLIDLDRTPAEVARLEHGARQLGAAFQNVNFLRDLADDDQRLGRSYLTPGHRLTEAEKAEWVNTIRQQLAAAQDAIAGLPKDARTAVRCACALFTALTDRIATTPVAELYRQRVRVPNAVKARLTAHALMTAAREGRK
ncbi:phytoene/squalene synthase family protein [Brevibacterium sp. CFH 10365]|uniref:phytoene/squalene synthase family protein n=1 Tax=Brevibacterium sp. CFH 10365 TaxID=2585207 RepID=UPI001266885B|nr:squalene/phytoene synthase family protein [Brevibacterium sp. CFH 10365]